MHRDTHPRIPAVAVVVAAGPSSRGHPDIPAVVGRNIDPRPHETLHADLLQLGVLPPRQHRTRLDRLREHGRPSKGCLSGDLSPGKRRRSPSSREVRLEAERRRMGRRVGWGGPIGRLWCGDLRRTLGRLEGKVGVESRREGDSHHSWYCSFH